MAVQLRTEISLKIKVRPTPPNRKYPKCANGFFPQLFSLA